jgi:hypothetical protein
MKSAHTIFHARVGLVRISQNARWETLRRTCVFASGGICGSGSAFWCVQGVKRDRIIFLARWDQYGFDRKRVGTHYVELVFLHPVGSVGHVVHFDASGT